MSGQSGAATEPGIIEYNRTIWQNRRRILGIGLTTGALAGIISFFLPPSYQASTTIIPAVAADKLSAIGQLGANLEDFGLQTSPKGNSPAMYPEIVRSRRLLEQVLRMSFSKRPDGSALLLIDIVQPRGSGGKRVELAVKKLRSNVDAALDRRTGVLTIRSRARSPEVAAGVANALSELLQDFAVHSFTSQAGENRRFIEGRLMEVQGDLTHAEEELRAFRERNLRIGNSPRLLLEEGRLARGLREQEEIYLALRRQYELTKVEEHRDVPVLNILDVAAIPTLRNAPRRGLVAALGTLMGLAMSLGIVLVRVGRSQARVKGRDGVGFAN